MLGGNVSSRKPYFLVALILILALIVMPLSSMDNSSEPEFVEIKNLMIFGDSGQGEDPNFNTGKMVKVITDG